MAITRKRLVSGSQVATTSTTYYTAAASTRAVIGAAAVCNTTGTADQITIYLVPSAGSADATNTLISARTVAAGETYACPELIGQVIETGGTIRAKATTSASALTLVVSGTEIV